MNYSEKLKDPRWQKKRLEVLERDGWKCRYCRASDKPLHVHHLVYLKNKDPWEINSGFLITFCEECHKTESEDGCWTSHEMVLDDVGEFLSELWKAGYHSSDLRPLGQAIQEHRRRPGGALIDFTVASRYLEDYQTKE